MATRDTKAQPSGDPHRPQELRKTIYKVVINHEEQYSIWPTDRKLPMGWKEGGKAGTQEECMAFIKKGRK